MDAAARWGPATEGAGAEPGKPHPDICELLGGYSGWMYPGEKQDLFLITIVGKWPHRNFVRHRPADWFCSEALWQLPLDTWGNS